MASVRALRWASWAAGFGSAAFALSFVRAVWTTEPAAPPPPESIAVSAPPPSVAPPDLPPAAEAVFDDAARAYLAAALREPRAGEASHEVAAERRVVFQREVARLTALGPGTAALLLARVERETDEHARLLFLTALSRIDGDRGGRIVPAALEAPEPPTLAPRKSAPERRHDDARAADAVLRDPSPVVRAQALAAAEAFGAQIAPDVLEQMAHGDPDPAVRERAISALAATNPAAFVSFARRTFEAGAPGAEQARLLTAALARSDDPEAGALLTELAFDPDPAVRKEANRALRAPSAPEAAR